ncbi:erythromycin esterase family protein [Thermomonospora amylolytica]|uniref:erythromycin esterase family protein n=1 Tax=Thermomonospora amylolytica TaxID=1411117 RepID=UPI00130046F4|nr:erythromycin esterase family protein [Thermomonospora amylolytica]
MDRFSRRAFTLALAATLLAGAAPAAHAGDMGVVDWVGRHAVPINGPDPEGALNDLAALRTVVGDAQIVGLGESTHGAGEETALKHRALRYLVEEMGFRSIAWEDDWTVGLEVNRYLLTGEGDVDAVVRKMSTTWHTREVAAVLEWLRDYNAAHADKVQFVGVEFFSTGLAAYDAVRDHIAEVSPGLLPAADHHLAEIRPKSPDIGAHLRWYYFEVEDKQPYVEHARRLYELVEKAPRRGADHRLALHHARQILSWYEYFAQDNMNDYRDIRAAENLRWWRDRTRDKVVYWAATPHTAAAPDLTITMPDGVLRFDPAGSHLRRWYGHRYKSIAFTFDHGTLIDVNGSPAQVPSPPSDWADAPFGKVRPDQFILNLHTPAPPKVRAWLRTPSKMRIVADYDPARPDIHHMTGAPLSRWFDAVVHRQAVTPPTPL